MFDEYTPKLKNTVFGSDEYKEQMKGMKVALDHHYAHNSHHPEHYENGINGFDLFDLIEMFFDWKAASERSLNGNIQESIDVGARRFGIGSQLTQILANTAGLTIFYEPIKVKIESDFNIPRFHEKANIESGA